MERRHGRFFHPRRAAFPWRRLLRIVAIMAAILAIAAVPVWFFMIRMPGQSHRGPLPALTPAEVALSAALRGDVEHLATTIGERSVWQPRGLSAAADHVEQSLRAAGMTTARLPFESRDHRCENIEGSLAGSANKDEIV